MYNDLKLDNIMIGTAGKSIREDASVKLIDFGLVKPYRDDKGNHLQWSVVDLFRGNRIFASPNSMNMGSPSRKDDLVSLYYTLVYLIDGDLPFLTDVGKKSDGN